MFARQAMTSMRAAVAAQDHNVVLAVRIVYVH